MASGVSFNKPAGSQSHRRKRSLASTSLVIAFLLLLAVISTYGVFYYFVADLTEQKTNVEAKITETEQNISDAVASVASVLNKKNQFEKNMYREHATDEVLTKMQELMVPRIVLQSFDHVLLEREGTYRVSVTADADNFDVMAAQIAAWKNSSFFSRVEIGDSERDDAGRIVFAADLDLTPLTQQVTGADVATQPQQVPQP